MNIRGMGLLFSRGRGIAAFQNALRAGWQDPAMASLRGRSVPACLVDLERIEDRAVLKKLRRADKLSKMAVLAAMEAVADSGLGPEETKRLGVIVATAYGAHVTTFEFLDGILDFGEAAVSPTVFSNSVHNAAASYISSALEIRGPTLTVTQFFFSFQAALQLASAWLREGRVEHVLVGAVDQFGDVLGYIAGERLTQAKEGRIRPFLFKQSGAVPGEGAAFFLVSGKNAEQSYCTVEGIRFSTGQDGAQRSDLDIIDADGMLPDESVYAAGLVPGTPAAAYSPLYGSMMTGSAFSCAAAALMLRDRRLYPSPVADNPRGLHILAEPLDSSVEFIRCIRYNCYGDRAVLYLRKKQAPDHLLQRA